MSAAVDPSLPLERDVRRLLAVEIEGAIEALGTARATPANGIHATRKRFKRVRALLKLVRSGDEEFYERENARYRDLSRSLAPAREATALVETVDRFIAEYPRETGVLAGLRERLAERVPQAGDAALEWVIAKAISTVEAGGAAGARFTAVSRPKDASQILERGVEKTLRQSARALKAAEEAGGPDDFHELRKQVKAHAAHLSLLAAVWPKGGARRRNAADRLGTVLGDLNDLAVMQDLIDKAEEPLGTDKEVATLGKLIRRKRKTLVRHALAAARKLFDERPKDVAERLAKSYRAAAEDAAGAANG